MVWLVGVNVCTGAGVGFGELIRFVGIGAGGACIGSGVDILAGNDAGLPQYIVRSGLPQHCLRSKR